VLPMVRVDRLYLVPMFRLINWVARNLSAPLGTSGDKMCYIVKLGSELLPDTAVFAWLSGPVRAHVCSCPLIKGH
jgi:hypothetical protein